MIDSCPADIAGATSVTDLAVVPARSGEPSLSIELRSGADSLAVAITAEHNLSPASFTRVLIAAQSRAQHDGLAIIECATADPGQRRLAERLGFCSQPGSDTLSFRVSPGVRNESGLLRVESLLEERCGRTIGLKWSSGIVDMSTGDGRLIAVRDDRIGMFDVHVPIDGSVTEDGLAQVIIGARDFSLMLGHTSFDTVSLSAPPQGFSRDIRIGLSIPDDGLVIIHPALAGGLRSPLDHLIAAEASGYIAASDLSPLHAVMAHELWHITEACELAVHPERAVEFWQALRIEVLEEVVGIRASVARRLPWADLLQEPALAHAVSRRATTSPSELTAELWVAGHSMDPPDIATAFLAVAHRLLRR